MTVTQTFPPETGRVLPPNPKKKISSLRIEPEYRRMLRQAAFNSGKSQSEFIRTTITDKLNDGTLPDDWKDQYPIQVENRDMMTFSVLLSEDTKVQLTQIADKAGKRQLSPLMRYCIITKLVEMGYVNGR